MINHLIYQVKIMQCRNLYIMFQVHNSCINNDNWQIWLFWLFWLFWNHEIMKIICLFVRHFETNVVRIFVFFILHRQHRQYHCISFYDNDVITSYYKIHLNDFNDSKIIKIDTMRIELLWYKIMSLIFMFVIISSKNKIYFINMLMTLFHMIIIQCASYRF